METTEQQPATSPAPRVQPRGGGAGDHVTVACKLPNGFVLEIFDWSTVREYNRAGDIVETRVSRRTGRSHVLNGHALDVEDLKKGRYPGYPIEGGYALTPGVPRDLWERWVHDNAGSPLLVNHIIFAASSTERAGAQAREQVEVESGLEPVDQDNHAKRDPAFRLISRDQA